MAWNCFPSADQNRVASSLKALFAALCPQFYARGRGLWLRSSLAGLVDSYSDGLFNIWCSLDFQASLADLGNELITFEDSHNCDTAYDCG